MKIDVTDLSPVKKRMAIEVASDEVDRELRGVLRTYARKAKVPGFRPGKTPLEVIRERFRDEVDQDLRERIVSRSFERAAREKGLRPVGEASLEEVSHEAGRPFAFKTTFEVLPDFEVAGYKDLQVRRPGVGVADEEVDRALEDLRAARVRHVYEPDRQADKGDIVVADIEGRPAAAEPFRRERAEIEIGGEHNLAEFNDKLVGVREGGEIEFTVDYPAGYRAAELAGKRVDFRLGIHEVKRRELPALDDDFARELGEEFTSLADLRRRVADDLGRRKAQLAEQTVRQALIDKVLLANTVVLPEVLVEREVRHRLEDLARNLLMQGVDLEKAEIDWSQLRERQLEPARKAVHARLVLDAIARAEHLEVERREVDERIRAEAHRLGERPEKVRARLEEQHGVEVLRAQLLREKTLDYLTTVANIQNEE